MPLHKLLALAVFALTYFAIANGKLPPLRLDRAGAALAGAVAMMVIGAVHRQQALDAIDFSTLALLLGMMIVVANLRLSGAFTLAARAVLPRARSGFGLLAITSAATITGNPQNMIVAGYAHLTYGAFALRLAPIALAGLVADYAIIAFVYRSQLGPVRRRVSTGTLRR